MVAPLRNSAGAHKLTRLNTRKKKTGREGSLDLHHFHSTVLESVLISLVHLILSSLTLGNYRLTNPNAQLKHLITLSTLLRDCLLRIPKKSFCKSCGVPCYICKR
ncbi:hypothetical protein YC2023_073265 [Brassica napus]